MINFAVMEHYPQSILYKQWCGEKPESCTPIAGAGSQRRYFRLGGSHGTAILTLNDNPAENDAFISLSNHFAINGVEAPEVLAVADDRHSYLQSDLGDTSLYSLLQGRDPGTPLPIVEQTMRLLADAQHLGTEDIKWGLCYPVAAMDKRSIDWDLNYFKYSFLKPALDTIDENALEDDFDSLRSLLLEDKNSCHTLMLRDFQSRNVMITDGRPYLIDYQGARRGPVEYDVASFLWQARAGFTDEERLGYMRSYLRQANRYKEYAEDRFTQRVEVFAIFRTLQTLGAYGFRGFLQHNSLFMTSAATALRNLQKLLTHTPVRLPYLGILTKRLCELPRFRISEPAYNGLTVRVISFSYRKGIPEDTTGNGGGFVFDCRYMRNPGRYEEYKHLTGLDRPVRDFLEKQGEIDTFLRHATALADAAIDKYLSRGFTSLQVCFGCTGGQHRSVYAAEALAHHIARKEGVRVILTHREQNIHTILPISPKQ